MNSFVITIVIILFISSCFSANRRILLVDHDGGADDAMAIFMGILNQHDSRPKLLALTTTHANVPEPQTFINTQRILWEVKEFNIPIFRGSNYSLVESVESDNFFGVDGLGDIKNDNFKSTPAKEGHAANALINYSKKYNGNLEVLTLGALTNVAMAIRLDPLFIGRLKQLYIAAGHVAGSEFTKPEFNAMADVEAYRVVADAADPDIVTVIPFSQIITSSKAANVTMDWRINTLGAINTDVMKWLNKREAKAWAKVKARGSPHWTWLDPFAMAIVLKPQLVTEMKYTNNSIKLCGSQRGINTNEFVDKEFANMKLVYSASAKGYQKLLFNLFQKRTGNEKDCDCE